LKTKTVNILRPFGIFLVSLFWFTSLIAQQPPAPVRFKNGLLTREKNISRITSDSLQTVHFRDHFYVLLQFDKLPEAAERSGLQAKGIRLFNYISGRAYLAEVPDDLPLTDLRQYAVSGVYKVPASLKISPRLAANPEAYTSAEGQLIAVNFFGTVSKEAAGKALEQAGATLVATKIKPDKVLFIRAGKTALQRIAALPYINYIGPQSLKDQPLNYNNRATHGLDALNNDPVRHLQGNGVAVGMGDNSTPYTHVDFTGRLIDRFSQPVDLHGTHTSGTVAGGGILNPLYKGMAPHATLISQYFSDILVNAETYLADYDMSLTNNSYTAYDPGCSWEGEYDFLSYYVDGQLKSYPNLLHVFASGNDGRLSCTPYSLPYATVKSGYQCAKNVLTVGNIDNSTYIISPGSSCGPVNDGRLKPEIVAGGTNITSTYPNNNYGTTSGTSMATPTVTGTLALLVQRYRQLQGGGDPPAALIKATACNTATDRGNPGPDFIYGFGSLDARAAVEALESHRYQTGAISNGGNYTYTLTGIPAGLHQLKVLLYWPDVPAAPDAAAALVNDLDLTVTTPAAIVHQPLILNPSAGHTADIAAEGADHLNNIEQVVIDNPPAGNFTLTVKGTGIAAGSQDFVLVWQSIAPAVVLQYPVGLETWIPGSGETIRWNAYGADANTFSLEYSPDNGGTWALISNSIPSSQRLYNWTTPTTATSQGLIRISRNGTAYSDVSAHNFSILGQPAATVTNPCQGYALLTWSAIPSATAYEIFQLKGDSMSKVATTTSTSYLLGRLSKDSAYWLAVGAVNGSTPGRRSLASQITPSGGSCALSALDKDITTDAMTAPSTGRQFTSSQLNAAETIRTTLKNLGTVATSVPFDLSYRINGGPVVSESSSAVIAAGGVYNYSFTAKADLSAPGAYTIQTWVTYPGDPQPGNDTLTRVVKQLQNDPVTLNPAYTEGFESAAPAEYISPVQGFTGLDRCDFSRSNANGRARTFINSGFARTGIRSAILDQVHYSAATTTDSLITTFNLTPYSVNDQIWLNFFYRNQGIDSFFPGNQVWIRGNDQADWVPAYTLDATSGRIGAYQPSSNIDITGLLKAAIPSQTVSSSFQIKFGQQGHTSATSLVTDADLDDGYSFDDITITRAANDVSVISLTGPSLSPVCALSNGETIRLKVKNYGGTPLTNIPVTYSINGVDVTEHIPSINANDSVIYSFTKKADLSAYRSYSVRAWVTAVGDTYIFNDSLPALVFHTAPMVSAFPYLEGFESNDGYWYTGGTNSSWQWGAPVKTIIDKAANGKKCWTTSLTGGYNDNELSYLYSPCFDLSTLANPVLSFSHIFQMEDNCMCDFHWVEYSTDGLTWTKLGTSTWGVNWYDNAPRQAWQLSDTLWHVSSYDIPVNAADVRFRIVMNSDPGTHYEGIAIDDIHIFDKAAIYASHDTALTRPVKGNDWVNFDLAGQRILSLQPNGQDLGNVTVKVFMNTGGIRNDGRQYYLDRNLVVQPSLPPAGKVAVRCYFTDLEARDLISANGCATCSGLSDAYQAGITQYSSAIGPEEDSSLANNATGFYHFLLPHQDVTVIPYDNGYYTTFSVDGFSEFWIDGGGPLKSQPEDPTLLSFTATRSGNRGLLQWTTGDEINASRFIIEKSPDGTTFTSLDSIAARNGDTINTYHYADNTLWKGLNYYRLKLLDQAGRYNYSIIRALDMNGAPAAISIYPNPWHNGELYITSSTNLRHIRLANVSGRIILQTAASGNAHTLTPGRLSQGIYLIIIDTEGGRKVEKLLVK
jgi:hypothetical protein